MFDPSLIKDNYKQMSDDQLIHLAKTEGNELSAEALTILHEEFIDRNLNTDVFGTVEDIKEEDRKENQERIKEAETNEQLLPTWNYIFDEKRNGSTNEEIYNGLLQREIDKDSATLMISSMEAKAKDILASHEADKLRGGLVCAAGLAITFVTYSAVSTSGGTYVVAWGAIIFGAIRFFKALNNCDKYKEIIEILKQENTPSKEAIEKN